MVGVGFGFDPVPVLGWPPVLVEPGLSLELVSLEPLGLVSVSGVACSTVSWFS